MATVSAGLNLVARVAALFLNEAGNVLERDYGLGHFELASPHGAVSIVGRPTRYEVELERDGERVLVTIEARP